MITPYTVLSRSTAWQVRMRYSDWCAAEEFHLATDVGV
jgi:hypothetical protein